MPADPQQLTPPRIVAQIGDIVETDFTQPYRHKLKIWMETPEQCAYANKVLNEPGSRFRLIQKEQK